jgi:hypothetical protein
MRHPRGSTAFLAVLSIAGCAASPSDEDAGIDAGRRCAVNADCDDGIACTVDTCGPARVCQYTGVDGLCGDGETCMPGIGCVPTGCRTNADCDDAVECTVDTCGVGNVCNHTPVDGLCPAGQGCDPLAGCVDVGECTTDEECDDGVACTIDSCIVGNVCSHEARDALCPAGQRCDATTGCYLPIPCTTWEDCPIDNFCDGRPHCEPEFGCQPPRTPRECNDDDDCTTDSCDRDVEACVWTPSCEGACIADHLDVCLWNGCFDLDTTISQRCAMGGVNYNINRVCFSIVGSGAARMLSMQTMNSSGARHYTLNQAPFPTDAAFDASFIVSGGCEEVYRLEGRFRESGGVIDANTFDAVWTATYIPHDTVSCALGGCPNQNVGVVGTRM